MSAAALLLKLGWAVMVTAGLGAAGSRVLPLGSAFEAAAVAVAAAGLGWLLLLAATRFAPAAVRRAAVDALATTMAAGVTVLVPAVAAAFWLEGSALGLALAVGVAASFAVMLSTWSAAVRRIGLARGWVPAWILSLWLGAGAVVLVLLAVAS